VTITLPDAGSRFMSMQIIDEDHYVPAVRVRRGTLHLHAPADRHAVHAGGDAHVRQSFGPERHRGGPRAKGKDAMYVTVVPAKNDGKTIHRVTVKDVTVDAFCSISVYNAKGYFEPNPLNAYTFNNVTGTKAADGSITVQFGGCDAKTPNCLPISPGWNYWVRLYRPRPEILNGKWTFPAAEPCGERRPTSRPHRRWPLSSSLRRSHRPLAKPLPRAQANLPGIS